jgi:hypothetical protein
MSSASDTGGAEFGPGEHAAKQARTLLSVGVFATLLGIAASAGEPSLISSVMTIAGLLLTIAGLHRFGRSGPDRPVKRGRKASSRRQNRHK